MKKINLVELLKDCPKGMELDCTMFEDVYFERVQENCEYPIVIRIGKKTDYKRLTKEGCWNKYSNAKCVIFPKGKTTWEGFVPPCKFKDGDIIYIYSANPWICIYKEGGEKANVYYKYVAITTSSFVHDCFPLCHRNTVEEIRHATEEEKQKLFQAIKDNGYKWNAETKALEELIQLKFKVGDRVKSKINQYEYTIVDIRKDVYIMYYATDKFGYHVPFCDEDKFDLVTNKFDINTLVPFESRVLVRNSDIGFWQPAFWGIYEGEKANEHQRRNYLTTKGFFRHCIPYNDDTKHLLGTTNDCDKFYRIWEKTGD